MKTAMKTAMTWLRMVREDEGTEETKRVWLREKGYTEKEVEELLKWDRGDSE